MFFTSPTSNITPALISTAMSRSDSRDSTSSSSTISCIGSSSFSSAPMAVSYATSPFSNVYYRFSSSSTSTGAAMNATARPQRNASSSWLPSPYKSCMIHSSSSSGYESRSSYISDDDLLALENDFVMPPIEQIDTPSKKSPTKCEMTTEEHIAMLREREDAEQMEQRIKRTAPPQKVRFAVETKKPRRPSALSRKSSNYVRKTSA